jgi:hypothetical protein
VHMCICVYVHSKELMCLKKTLVMNDEAFVGGGDTDKSQSRVGIHYYTTHGYTPICERIMVDRPYLS